MRIKNLLITLKMPKKYDMIIHLAVLVLILFGTLMIMSTNVGSASSPLNLLITFVKQLVFIVISYVLLVFFANNFTMHRAQKLIFAIGIVLILAMLSTQLFTDVNGSKAWIRIPLGVTEITLQPAEFVKVFMIVIMAVYVEMFSRRNYPWTIIMRIPLIFFGVFVVLILIQKDLGALLVMSIITAVCFLISAHPNLWRAQKFLIILIVLATLLGLFLMSETGIRIVEKIPVFQHVIRRFQSAANPFEDTLDVGYQLINGLYGLARGGLSGVGLGESIQKYGYLTQSDNDFILSIVVEELGIIGLSMVVIGYAVIIYRLFYYALRTRSEGYKIILIGTSLYIFTHFALNVGGISGLIPLTGVPLLFISSGGSSLMSVMTSIGISQAVIARIRRQGALKQRQLTKKEPRGK